MVTTCVVPKVSNGRAASIPQQAGRRGTDDEEAEKSSGDPEDVQPQEQPSEEDEAAIRVYLQRGQKELGISKTNELLSITMTSISRGGGNFSFPSSLRDLTDQQLAFCSYALLVYRCNDRMVHLDLKGQGNITVVNAALLPRIQTIDLIGCTKLQCVILGDALDLTQLSMDFTTPAITFFYKGSEPNGWRWNQLVKNAREGTVVYTRYGERKAGDGDDIKKIYSPTFGYRKINGNFWEEVRWNLRTNA
jgi:hypothetical protein